MPLIDNLVSYWKLDEASGNAIDSHGTSNLTETSGTIDSNAAGKINGSRDFEAGDTEYFEKADNADLSTGDIDFSFAFWIKFESPDPNGGFGQVPLSKGTFDGTREYGLVYSVSLSRFIWAVSADGSSNVTVVANTFGTLSIATWYFVAMGHNATSNDIWISVNAGTPDTTSHSGGVINDTQPFRLGCDNSGIRWFDGILDEVAFFKRDIRADLASFYNTGIGLPYPFSLLATKTLLTGGQFRNASVLKSGGRL